MNKKAVGIRACRIIKENLRLYDEVFFENGHAGCERMLRMMYSLNWIKFEEKQREDNLWLDIISADGEILHEWPISRGGFEFLHRRYKFLWQRIE